MTEPEEILLNEVVAQSDEIEPDLSKAFSRLSYFVAFSILLVIGISLGSFDKLRASSTGAIIRSLKNNADFAHAEIIVPTDPFRKVHLTAQAAIVYDPTSDKTLFELNARERLPLASLTKIMTAMLARSSHESATSVEISERALLPEGDQGLLAHDTWRLSALAALTLVSSSNDGAEALAEIDSREIFIRDMNARAEELGLKDTYFFNPTGLDVSERVGGSYGSAYDVARLLTEAVKTTPDIFENTAHSTYAAYSLYGPLEVDNTNNRTGEFPGLIASKTGFTDLAGGNIAIMFDAGLAHPIVVVVMGSDLDKRIDEAYALANATRKYLSVK
ncbi:MAG: serine hydrolase [bacterium]|nr:serine hydrolase [bacterium]